MGYVCLLGFTQLLKLQDQTEHHQPLLQFYTDFCTILGLFTQQALKNCALQRYVVEKSVFSKIEILNYLELVRTVLYVCLLPTRVLGLLNQQKLTRGQTNSGKALLEPQLQRGGEGEQTTGTLACSLPEAGQACSLYGMKVGVGLEGRLRWFAHPLGGVVCRGHAQYAAFAPGSSKVAVGFFCLLSRICPNCNTCSYFQSRIISLYFVAPGEVCPGASVAALQQRVPGPSLSYYQ